MLYYCTFLGGLSLSLNHLIAWQLRISFWQFGTLPIGIILSNLDSRHLMTSPRTLFGQFWHVNFWWLQDHLRNLPKLGAFRKSIFFSMKEWQVFHKSYWFKVGTDLIKKLWPMVFYTPWFGFLNMSPIGCLLGWKVPIFEMSKNSTIFFTPQISKFWAINWHRYVLICEFMELFFASGVWTMATRVFWWKVNCMFMARRVDNCNGISFDNL